VIGAAVMVGRIATGELEEKRPSKKRPLKSQELSEPAMNPFHDAAYNMAAVSATVALYRALIKKGELDLIGFIIPISAETNRLV
jgi:hypothetical protein